MKEKKTKFHEQNEQVFTSQQNQQKYLFLIIWPGSKPIYFSAYPDQDKILLQY